MSEQSLADRFIRVMADIHAMEPDGDDPMRYAIWHLQDQAKQAISNAIGTAHNLILSADMMKRYHRDAVEELRATTQDKETQK